MNIHQQNRGLQVRDEFPGAHLFQNGWARVLAAVVFWTAVVLLYSLYGPTALQFQSFTTAMALKFAAARWYPWAILAPLIIRIDRLLPVRKDALGRRLLLHVPISLLFTAVYTALNRGIMHVFFAGTSLSRTPFLHYLPQNFLVELARLHILVYWMILGSHLILEYQRNILEYQRNLKERQLRAANLERLLSESRLETLRTQLHPHFLFNTLNTISAYIEQDPRGARRILDQLGALLRLSLNYAEHQEIPLEKEISFLDHYLALQKARFEDRLEVIMKIDSDVLDALIPTFLLQPIVENAIQHGISCRLEGGVIEIAAWPKNDQLRLMIRNNGPGLAAGWDSDHTPGIGIANTRQRLECLYGEEKQTFAIVSERDAGVRVDITLPLHHADVLLPACP